MKIILLVVLFSTPSNPEPHEGSRYGYGHRSAPTMEACLKRRDFLMNTLAKHANEDEHYTAFCVEMEVFRYTEALQEFRRSLGDVL